MRAAIIDTLRLSCTFDTEYFVTWTFAFDGITRTDETNGALVVFQIILKNAEGFHLTCNIKD